MFNYHTYEKLQKKRVQEEDDILKDLKEKVVRREKNKVLVNNYEQRINDFIISMVDKPIMIKDYKYPVENPREELMKETDDKITGRKGFVFKGFVTEKERIKNYLEEKNKFVELEDPKKKKPSNNNKYKYKYVQPQMRYKPRTELERIFDSINEYSYGRVDKGIVYNQLRKLDLNNMKKFKNEDNSYNDVEDSINMREKRHQQISQMNIKELIKEKQRQDDLAKIDEEMINPDKNNENGSIRDKFKSKRILVDNSAAKNLMKEYHYKTHFKAACVVASRNVSITDANYTSQKKSNINVKQQPEINQTSTNFRPGQKFKQKHNSTYDDSVITQSQAQGFNRTGQNFNTNIASNSNGFNLFQKFSKKFTLEEENLDLIECNPLLYNQNLNPLKNKNQNKLFDQDKLNYLIKLAAEKKEEPTIIQKKNGVKFFTELKAGKKKFSSLFNDSPVKFFKKFEVENGDEMKRNDDEKVWIDNQAVPKYDVEFIAQKILKNCNYHHPKKNNEILKKGNGKLMITSGMTVGQFIKKYHF